MVTSKGFQDIDIVTLTEKRTAQAKGERAETARMPSGAVASWLEKAGKKKTTFLLGILNLLTLADYK